MIFVSSKCLWLSLSLYSAVSRASPSSDDIKLAMKYAPLWKFHKEENYFPSTIENFLTGMKVEDGDGNVVLSTPNTDNLDNLPNQGSNMYLTTDIESGMKGFLRGQNPSTNASKAYTILVSKPSKIVDIYYWLFTPFNLGKAPLSIIDYTFGDHVSDWEHMRVRTKKGKATHVEYFAHSQSGSGIIPWSQAPKFDNGLRPVGYVANGSHGFWNASGTFTYLQIANIKVQDVTSDDGVAWDIQNDLQVYKFPDIYNGTDGWLNYKGLWGNRGQQGCGDLCELVDGIPGPIRPDLYNATSTGSGSMSTLRHTSSEYALLALLVATAFSFFI